MAAVFFLRIKENILQMKMPTVGVMYGLRY